MTSVPNFLYAPNDGMIRVLQLVNSVKWYRNEVAATAFLGSNRIVAAFAVTFSSPVEELMSQAIAGLKAH
jgi:hypothetical protein